MLSSGRHRTDPGPRRNGLELRSARGQFFRWMARPWHARRVSGEFILHVGGISDTTKCSSEPCTTFDLLIHVAFGRPRLPSVRMREDAGVRDADGRSARRTNRTGTRRSSQRKVSGWFFSAAPPARRTDARCAAPGITGATSKLAFGRALSYVNDPFGKVFMSVMQYGRVRSDVRFVRGSDGRSLMISAD